MPQFKDEHIAIIAPGSQTTLAQLGLPESFTPAKLHIKSRMFPSEVEKGQYEPHKVRKKKPTRSNGVVNGDHGGADAAAAPAASGLEIEPEVEEDYMSDEGAVWPIQGGRIANWDCFFALLQHVYNTLSPHFHTPILLVAEPAWTVRERERITQFFFEKFKMPGFAMIDAATATCFAYGVSTACVVDVGASKANVTAVVECAVDEIGRGVALSGCGGNSLTDRLLELLKDKGFTWDMCEQLKKSSICEILPADTPLPGQKDADMNGAGADGASQDHRRSVGGAGGTEAGGDDSLKEFEDENEGIIDVASIVAGGKTTEYLARKEREKQEKAERKAKQKAAGEASSAAANAQAKAARLKNADREHNTFYYEDYTLYNALRTSDTTGPSSTTTDTLEPSSSTTDPTPKPSVSVPRREISVGTERFLAVSDPYLEALSTAIHHTILSTHPDTRRGELWDSLIIVGRGSSVRGFKEALLAALQARFLISPSSATIFTSELPSNMSTPLATGANTPQPQSRHDAAPAPHGGVNPLLLAATSQAQAQTAASGNPHLHPSSAHGQFHQHHHHQQQQQHTHLLQHAQGMAPATPQQTHGHLPSASQQHQSGQHQGSGSTGGGQHQHSSHHSSHAQTPTSIKLAKLPEYFPEWKEVGAEEAAFLGAQVAAKIFFMVDSSASVGGAGGKGWLNRSEYNEMGPSGIHECVL